MARDAKLIKDKLEIMTPCQILAGMYLYTGNRTISIPQFLHQSENWLENDELLAEAEVARNLSHYEPESYYVYLDLKEEREPWAINHAVVARNSLREWIDRVLI